MAQHKKHLLSSRKQDLIDHVGVKKKDSVQFNVPLSIFSYLWHMLDGNHQNQLGQRTMVLILQDL